MPQDDTSSIASPQDIEECLGGELLRHDDQVTPPLENSQPSFEPPNEEEAVLNETEEQQQDMNLLSSQTQHTDSTMNAELSISSSSSDSTPPIENSQHSFEPPNDEEAVLNETEEQQQDMNLLSSQTQHTDSTMNAELSSSSSSSDSTGTADSHCVSGIVHVEKMASTKIVFEPCGAPDLYYQKPKLACWRRRSVHTLIGVVAMLLGAATIGAVVTVAVLKSRNRPAKSGSPIVGNGDGTINVGSGDNNETTTDFGSGNNNETTTDFGSGNNNETSTDFGSGKNNETIIDLGSGNNETTDLASGNETADMPLNGDGVTHCVSSETANDSWNAIRQVSFGNLTSGPMVGHTTTDTAIIWAYGSSNATVSVMYQRLGYCLGQVEMVDMPMNQMTVQLNGLKASTRYRYHVLVNGTKAGRMGTFTTAPRKVKKFRYMFGSCISFKRDPIQTIWDEVLDQDPRFLILNGDTVYSNTVNYTNHWNYHMEQRQIEPFANIIRQRPTYATWDDHDYGPNDSDGTKIGKENSLQAFKDVFANPSYGTPDLPGIFTTFQYGDDVRWTVSMCWAGCRRLGSLNYLPPHFP